MKKLVLFLIILLSVSEVASARMRFSRSFGRRGSRSLFGARKSRSNLFRKKASPRTNTFKSKQNRNSNKMNSMMGPRRSGGFMRSMGGAIAGTMIGGMLFRALGIGGYGTAGAGAGSGGFGGILMLLLFGGGLFYLFKSRYSMAGNTGAVDNNYFGQGQEDNTYDQEETDELNYANDKNFLNDRNKTFFSVQHAWSKKDLTSVKGLMSDDIYGEFVQEINEMNNKGHTSTLENLMINNSEIMASWNENGIKYLTMKFDVSLIEYETDKSGTIVSGSKDGYTDISEYWTFADNSGSWKVTAVENSNT